MKRTALACLVLSFFLLSACGEGPDVAARKAAPWKFANGQIVESVLDGRRGQIVVGYRWPYGGPAPDSYDVRFSGLGARTNVSLVGADGPVESTPFVVLSMKEFELREAK
jgi:hypothetical protein